MLLKLASDLLDAYYRQPREMLLRGKHEAALARIERIGSVLDQDDVAVPIGDAQFQRDIAKWRDELDDAYAAENEKRVMQLWAADQYMVALLEVEGERPQKHPRRTLTLILLRACREPLGEVVEYVRASTWEEKAEKLAAQVRHAQAAGKPARSTEESAQRAWKNAQSAWQRYCDRAALGGGQVRLRLDWVKQQRQEGKFEPALAALELLHRDLHHFHDARIQRAEALAQAGNPQAARSVLETLHGQLVALEKDKALAEEVELWRRDTGSGHPLAKRLELLARDWTPDGNRYWVRMRVERLLARLKQM